MVAHLERDVVKFTTADRCSARMHHSISLNCRHQATFTRSVIVFGGRGACAAAFTLWSLLPRHSAKSFDFRESRVHRAPAQRSSKDLVSSVDPSYLFSPAHKMFTYPCFDCLLEMRNEVSHTFLLICGECNYIILYQTL